MHFHLNPKKSGLPATPAVQMVTLAPEEGSGEGEAKPLPNEESDSGESYEAEQEDTTISQDNVEISVRVAQASEAFTGLCFRCNKVGHQFCNKECDMFDPKFLNTSWGPAKTSKSWQAPGVKWPVQNNGDEGDSLRAAPLKSSEREKIEVGGKEEVQVHKAHAFPFPKNPPNPSSTDLLARKKHDAVPP